MPSTCSGLIAPARLISSFDNYSPPWTFLTNLFRVSALAINYSYTCLLRVYNISTLIVTYRCHCVPNGMNVFFLPLIEQLNDPYLVFIQPFTFDNDALSFLTWLLLLLRLCHWYNLELYLFCFDRRNLLGLFLLLHALLDFTDFLLQEFNSLLKS
jgi:hypothetical protein